MPLPKPSKMVSKRFKKLRPAIAASPSPSSPSPSPSSTLQQPWLPHPPREWKKIRVVCTDPDATDDSSSDEAAQPSPSLSSSSCLSVLSSSSCRKRLIREFSLPLPSPPSPPSTPQTRPGRRRLHPEVSASDAHVDALAAARPELPRGSLSAESADAEEEFARFLRELLPEHEEEDLWKFDASRSDALSASGALGEMLDLELDSEALSWIDSMQRLP